jgi:hypothetical protein
MPGRCCDRCGQALTKPATLLELTHRSARGTERDARVLCLECVELVTRWLSARAVQPTIDRIRSRRTAGAGVHAPADAGPMHATADRDPSRRMHTADAARGILTC